MVQKTRLTTLLVLGSALLASGVHAQTTMPGSTTPATTGAVDNRSAASTAGTTGAPGTTGSSTVISSTDMVSTDTTSMGMSDDSALKETGGEPWLMAFGGLALAAGALTLRRRIN